MSPPRLHLLLVEGTLVFARRDLHLRATYIMVRGGTLQIGTEAEPFLQQATITMCGPPPPRHAGTGRGNHRCPFVAPRPPLAAGRPVDLSPRCRPCPPARPPARGW